MLHMLPIISPMLMSDKIRLSHVKSKVLQAQDTTLRSKHVNFPTNSIFWDG